MAAMSVYSAKLCVFCGKMATTSLERKDEKDELERDVVLTCDYCAFTFKEVCAVLHLVENEQKVEPMVRYGATEEEIVEFCAKHGIKRWSEDDVKVN